MMRMLTMVSMAGVIGMIAMAVSISTVHFAMGIMRAVCAMTTVHRLHDRCAKGNGQP